MFRLDENERSSFPWCWSWSNRYQKPTSILSHFLRATAVRPIQKSNLFWFFCHVKTRNSMASQSSKNICRDTDCKVDNVVNIWFLDPMQPHLLVLAWKLRSKKFFEFYDTEWSTLWALEQVFTFSDMKKYIETCITEVHWPDPFPPFLIHVTGGSTSARWSSWLLAWPGIRAGSPPINPRSSFFLPRLFFPLWPHCWLWFFRSEVIQTHLVLFIDSLLIIY